MPPRSRSPRSRSRRTTSTAKNGLPSVAAATRCERSVAEVHCGLPKDQLVQRRGGKAVELELRVRAERRALSEIAQAGVLRGPEHDGAHVPDLGGDELQRQQRVLVVGVDVVDHDEHRRLRGTSAQQRRQRVEQREARLLEQRLGLLFAEPEALGQAGRDPSQPAYARAERALEPGRVAVAEELVGDPAHGQKAGVPDSCQQRPHATRKPSAAASSASRVARAVLPIPASPPSSTTLPWPSAARVSVRCSTASSASRPRSPALGPCPSCLWPADGRPSTGAILSSGPWRVGKTCHVWKRR